MTENHTSIRSYSSLLKLAPGASSQLCWNGIVAVEYLAGVPR